MKTQRFLQYSALLLGGLLGVAVFLAILSLTIAGTISGAEPSTHLWYELIPSPKQESSFYGFSDFLSALALLVIIYTLSDFKYRLRISLLPRWATHFAFILICFIGLLSLVGDYIFSNGTSLPAIIASRTTWQAILAAFSVALILAWLWFSFISPPILTRRSSKIFFSRAEEIIVNGNHTQMEVLAEELKRSIHTLIKGCYTSTELQVMEEKNLSHDEHRLNCYRLVLLFSNIRFCKVLAISNPHALIILLETAAKNNFYDFPMHDLVQNVTIELINTEESLLYLENKSFDNSYLGLAKPLTRTLFGELLRRSAFGDPITIHLWEHPHWGSSHYKLYLSCIIEYAKYAIRHRYINQDRIISGIFDQVEHSGWDFSSDRYRNDHNYRAEMDAKLQVVMRFIDDLLDLMDKRYPEGARNMPHKKRALGFDNSIHISITKVMQRLMRETGFATKEDPFTQWSLCHNTVWAIFRSFNAGPHRSLVGKLLRRNIYSEINRENFRPDYSIAPVVGFCLNVCGLKLSRNYSGKHNHDSIIRYFLIPFVENNFRRLYKDYRKVSLTMLQGGIRYEESGNCIVKTYRENLDGRCATEKLLIKGPPKGSFY